MVFLPRIPARHGNTEKRKVFYRTSRLFSHTFYPSTNKGVSQQTDVDNKIEEILEKTREW